MRQMRLALDLGLVNLTIDMDARANNAAITYRSLPPGRRGERRFRGLDAVSGGY